MEPSDETLLAACRRGDSAGWEALVRRYQRLVYTVPRRAGLDDDRAAEVFQLVFTRLLDRLDTIERPDRLSAWLATTARRETLAVVRRDRVHAFSSLEADVAEESEALADDSLLPDELLIRLEQQHLLREAVAALGDRCRRLLQLLFYEAEPPSYVEVAVALGIPKDSIGPTRARCLAKLREALGRDEI